MNHENYEIQFDDWIYEQGEIEKKGSRSKPFIGDRSYRHFDPRVRLSTLESNEANVIPYLKYPERLIHYSFYPFVRRDKKTRRYTKEFDSLTNQKKVTIKQKVRHIMYASHNDACIFGFYAYMLKKIHNKQVEELGLNNSVIAYRKIPRDDIESKNKSNIDFANDIYKSIKSQSKAAILAIDIKDFFGSMNHEKIYIKWAEILGGNKLPLGHQIV